MASIRSSLVDFGADPSSLRLLDDDSPELLPYATLVAARRGDDAALSVVEAVYEWQGAPLAFIVAGDSLEDGDHLHRIRRLLAMRGDAPYVAVVAPGSLEVYRLALDRKSVRQARVDWEGENVDRASVFPRLGNVRPQAAIAHRNWISNVVLRLLTVSTTDLIKHGLPHEDAISLVGRALFTRFLADRGLLPDRVSGPSTEASLFDARDVAETTSRWLDATFNGDLMPLSPGTFERLPKRAYPALGNILRRAPDGQLFLGWEEKWDNLDFSHIPVGVLSQAYELYLREHAPAKQKREGGYYTPKPIAELMVRAAFRALASRGAAKTAKVLDPAVGGGIFLLTTFRELVAEHWRADGSRPDTDGLRRILYNQLVGFDVNEAALRFAALGLYLLAIELDPNPRPVDKLKFGVLGGTVLHHFKQAGGEEGKDLGSLGPLVGKEHAGRYDLVIGNPPWASGTGLPDWKFVRETVARIAAGRRTGNETPPLPNEGLDLPFVWRAMEWARQDGQLAFALHARMLFQQGDGMPVARQALFEAVDVTSVINGADLRQTRVWPQVSAPFCILFATNRKPGPEAAFRFISPRIEESLNGAGTMRVDALSAEVVPARQLFETPDVLKILFRGTKADLGIIERIRMEGHPTLAEFWGSRIGMARGNRLRGSGNGYQKLRRSSRARRTGGPRGSDASRLHGLPEITVASLKNIVVETKSLEIFSRERVHRTRSRDLFVGPLLLVHKSPPAGTGRIGVAFSEEDVVFNETFYGYSPGGEPDAGPLVRYLALVLGSRLSVWLALVTSGEFGFERDVIEKATLDRIPIPDFGKLTAQHRTEIDDLVEGLRSGSRSWKEVDEWVMGLYGLGERDAQVVFDTLEFGLPFANNRKRAQAPPTPAARERFCEALQAELNPWCERFGSALAVNQVPPLAKSPWLAIEIRNALRRQEETVPRGAWTGLLKVADEAAATEILVRNAPDRLLVGRLAQRRYWSATQARLLAQRIAWSHVDFVRAHSEA